MSARSAVVSGATSGIGRALVDRLLDAGWSVTGLGRRDPERTHPRFRAVRVDLADPADRARALADLPAPDLLVNNAAEITWSPTLAQDLDAWRHMSEVNVFAAIDLCQRLVPRMPDDGIVVNVSSVVAQELPAPPFAPYAVTKQALDLFTASLRMEVAARGLRVARVAPGLVETPIYGTVEGFSGTEARIRQRLPRWLDPDDVAEAVLWIASRPAHVAVADLTLLPRHQER